MVSLSLLLPTFLAIVAFETTCQYKVGVLVHVKHSSPYNLLMLHGFSWFVVSHISHHC